MSEDILIDIKKQLVKISETLVKILEKTDDIYTEMPREPFQVEE